METMAAENVIRIGAEVLGRLEGKWMGELARLQIYPEMPQPAASDCGDEGEWDRPCRHSKKAETLRRRAVRVQKRSGTWL